MRLALALLLFAPAVAAAAIPPGPDPTPVDAYTGVLRQFEQRPLVAFLETHGSAQQHGFLRALVSRPDFDADVVVEFGTARYQVTIDRYVRGERVPLSSLSRVWRRTTQDSGVWNDPIYAQFFRAVRAANLTRAPERRIRVLLGDPPIDWRRIKTRSCSRRPRPSCLEYWIGRRSEHYASVVLDKVLGRGRRALLIAGAFHLIRPPAEHQWNETAIIERRYPGSIFTVKPHESFAGPDWQEIERRIGSWPVPSLALTRGTWLGALEARLAFTFENSPNSVLSGRLEERMDGWLVLRPAP